MADGRVSSVPLSPFSHLPQLARPAESPPGHASLRLSRLHNPSRRLGYRSPGGVPFALRGL